MSFEIKSNNILIQIMEKNKANKRQKKKRKKIKERRKETDE
jgi:hypothetical protein